MSMMSALPKKRQIIVWNEFFLIRVLAEPILFGGVSEPQNHSEI